MAAFSIAARQPGLGLTEASIARVKIRTGQTDAQMRAAIGQAATVEAGLRAVGLLPALPVTTPQPPAGFTFVTTSLGADFVTIGADRVIARAS